MACLESKVKNVVERFLSLNTFTLLYARRESYLCSVNCRVSPISSTQELVESGTSLSRRVSFDPLALLLDASLEGELELVKKTATEVADASAANDEGITGGEYGLDTGFYYGLMNGWDVFELLGF